MDRLNSEIQKASQEVTFLSTYMDHEYPIRLVQIANHERQVQQAKDSQQVREPLAQYLDYMEHGMVVEPFLLMPPGRAGQP